MHTNIFSIDEFRGVHVSSIVNEVIRKIPSFFIFFYENILSAQKRVISKIQLTKQKQVNTKQQRQQFLRTQKLPRG